MILFSKYSLSIFFIVCSFLSTAQNYNIRGSITNEGRKPVSFASVKLKKDSSDIVFSFCISDVNGKYLLPVRQLQKGWIVVSAVGFVDFQSFFQFTKDDTLNIDIQLSTATKELPGITVKNKPSIEISGDTTSYNVDRFKRGNESTVSELLNNVPGFTNGPNGIVTYNGKVIDRVLINGDDITGTNYSKLIINLDVSGIEKLQVIQNYSADDNLLNKLISGKEQVLNIAYKKGFLRKFFGTADGFIGLPVKYYNAGLQAMGLFDKVKILAINRTNSVGKMNVNPGNTNLPDDIRIDLDNDIELINRNPLASIDGLTTGIDGVNPLYKNNSAATMLNFLIKPVKRVSIKGYFNFFYDRFNQQMDNTTTYFIEPVLSLQKDNNILRRLQKINGLFSLNYFPDSKNQLHFSWKNTISKNLSNAFTSLAGANTFSENKNAKENQSGLKILYNHLLPKEAAYSFSIQYNYGSFPGNYFVSPTIFHDFFNLSGFNSSLSQQEYQKFENLFIQTKLIKKINRHTFSLSFYGKNTQDRICNTIDLASLQDIKSVEKDSVNNSKVSLFTAGIVIQDRWVISKRLSVSISSEVQHYTGNLYNLTVPGKVNGLKGLRVLPGLDVGFKISKESRLNFSLNYGNRFSDPKYTGHGYAVQNITSVYKNVDTLQMRLTRSLNLFYSYANLLEKKIILFSNLSFINSPVLFLNQIQSYQSFAYYEFLSADKTIQAMNLLISGHKFSHNYRTQLVPTINISKGYTYTIIQGKEEKINFKQIQATIGFNTEVNDVQLKSSILYSIKSQDYSKTITNKYMAALLNINWKFGKRVFMDIDLKYNYIKPQEQSKIDFFSTSIKLQCKSTNDKWEFGLLGTNIFNQSSYSKSMLTEITLSNTSYKLFPRVLMSYIKYRF